MTNKPIIFKEFAIRDVMPSGVAYGINMQDAEQVFINSTLVDKLQCEVGDDVRAAVTPNNKSDDIDWYAIMVDYAGKEE